MKAVDFKIKAAETSKDCIEDNAEIFLSFSVWLWAFRFFVVIMFTLMTMLFAFRILFLYFDFIRFDIDFLQIMLNLDNSF